MTDYTDISSVIVTGDRQNVVVSDRKNEIRDGTIGRSDLAADVAAAVKRSDLGKLGLADPNPGTARLRPLPGVMASPPTVTVSAGGAATTVPNAVEIVASDPRFRYYRAGTSLNGTSVLAAGLTGARLSFACEFMFDGDTFDIRTQGQGGRYHFLVDGERVDEEYSSLIVGDSATYRITLAFSARKNRRIQIEMDGTVQVVAITVRKTDTVWPVSVPLGPRVIALGDSWTRGNNAPNPSDAFIFVTGDLLGWRDVWANGISGTGYLKPTKYRDRLATDVIPYKPDIVLVTGGINDATYTQQQIQDEAGAVFDTLQTGLPSALVIAVGAFSYTTPPPPEVTRARTAVAAAAAARSIPYIPTDGWLEGTGQVGATTTTGNANLYITGNHPNKDGHAYIGSRLAASIAAMMSAL